MRKIDYHNSYYKLRFCHLVFLKKRGRLYNVSDVYANPTQKRQEARTLVREKQASKGALRIKDITILLPCVKRLKKIKMMQILIIRR